jgi:hypothetical protein
MFGRISYTWSLMGASWAVVKQDKRLLLLPLLSALACLAVTASFVVPIALSGGYEPPPAEAPAASQVAYYGVLLLFYVCTYSVAFFFNAALVTCAIASLRGEEVSLGAGLRAALARLPLIVGWAILSATVGMVLRIIEDRSKLLGRIIAGLLGVVWSLTTFLVVPVIVMEQKGPVDAVKRSASMFKKTWGEQIIGNFSFGLVFFLLMIPGLAAVFAGVFMAGAGSVAGGVALAALGLLYMLVLGLVQSALAEIFRAALYLYAAWQETPRGFGRGLLNSAVGHRG